MVGIALGALGSAVGNEVGSMVGFSVGSALGSVVGNDVGSAVGSVLGSGVGASVGLKSTSSQCRVYEQQRLNVRIVREPVVSDHIFLQYKRCAILFVLEH